MLSVPLELSYQRRFNYCAPQGKAGPIFCKPKTLPRDLDSVPKSQYTFTSTLNIFGEFDIRYSKDPKKVVDTINNQPTKIINNLCKCNFCCVFLCVTLHHDICKDGAGSIFIFLTRRWEVSKCSREQNSDNDRGG